MKKRVLVLASTALSLLLFISGSSIYARATDIEKLGIMYY